MRIELHMHTRRYSACALAGPMDVVNHARELAYGAVFLTEHDAIWPVEELEALRRACPDVKIHSGVELTLTAGGGLQHLLVLGTQDERYLQLADRPAEVLARARDDGCLTVLAHPYRFDGGDRILHEGLLPDAIEWHTPNVDGEQAECARDRADCLHLPVVNAGDVHDLSFQGQFYIETDRPIERGTDIRQIVLDGEYRNVGPGHGADR